MKCLWGTLKEEKESMQKDKREGQEKVPKSYEIGAIGEVVTQNEYATLGHIRK